MSYDMTDVCVKTYDEIVLMRQNGSDEKKFPLFLYIFNNLWQRVVKKGRKNIHENHILFASVIPFYSLQIFLSVFFLLGYRHHRGCRVPACIHR